MASDIDGVNIGLGKGNEVVITLDCKDREGADRLYNEITARLSLYGVLDLNVVLSEEQWKKYPYRPKDHDDVQG